MRNELLGARLFGCADTSSTAIASFCFGGSMAKKENLGRLMADHDDHLIQLQSMNEDVGSQAWTKFMIAIQGGLGTAFGYILLSESLAGENNTCHRDCVRRYLHLRCYSKNY